ncbi:class I SAM-dependent methyltransferase [Parasphingopyxis marina]|uniref:Class I SAM-dependent methyltransferase n=1 Tax=Parasphingopyxis marina TaxID=2761622 RepID=A0A842HYR9_9SPHN|nr:class I SAM-dependent methyltransferase [Parasphingopyxis marina]MBC2777491.1 class I SAM-dependent methyltransferase [Parasphingopyxis marina]
MTRTIALLLAASAALSAPALAQQTSAQPESGEQPSILDRLLDRVLGPAQQAEETAAESEGSSLIEIILAEDYRAEDRARDRYRHPEETLAFFRVEPTMTVAEIGPGGGWYSRILAPLTAYQGRYLVVNSGTGGRGLDAEQIARANAATAGFPARVEEWTGVTADRVTAFNSDEIPEGLAGTVDRILVFRAMHGLLNNGIADTEIRQWRELLAEGGMIGVVQHRAPESEVWERANGSRGYLKQSDVIALFDAHGFELVGSSEINANPGDPANWERGVWTLPPTLAGGEENRSQYLAIGESDRMTLLFRKAD